MGKVDYEKAITMYNNNAEIKDIAKYFSVTPSAIRFGFKKHKVQLKKRFQDIKLAHPIETISYIAGLFDGEGSINILRHKNYFSLTAAIGLTHKSTIDWLSSIIGGHIRISKKSNKKHRTQYHWTVCSNQAAKFLRTIEPYLIIKRKECRVALRFQNIMEENRCGQKLSAKMINQRKELKNELEQLRKYNIYSQEVLRSSRR